MVKVWAATGYDIMSDENLVGRSKYTDEAIDRFGLEKVEGSEEEVDQSKVDIDGRYRLP